MKYTICTYGNPILRIKAKPVAKVDKTLRNLSREMLEIMKKNHGIGLAAEQIGQTHKICVIDLDPTFDRPDPDAPRLNPDLKAPLIMINPEIISANKNQTNTEGCLSIPEIFKPVNRAYEIEVSYLNIDGKQRNIKVKDFAAQVIQHEIDHLNGVLFVDRLSAITKISITSKLKKLESLNHC
jgi:peptide deformylase